MRARGWLPTCSGLTVVNPTNPKAPRIGKPLDLTPEALDQASMVTPVDVAQARALWLNAAPPKLADLLDAAPEGGPHATQTGL